MQEISIDLKELIGNAIMEVLEEYCRNATENYSDIGWEWAFGAADFARTANLIDALQHYRIMEEYHGFTKEDPSGGNRMGSSK